MDLSPPCGEFPVRMPGRFVRLRATARVPDHMRRPVGCDAEATRT
jgi:hypothetical protein